VLLLWQHIAITSTYSQVTAHIMYA